MDSDKKEIVTKQLKHAPKRKVKKRTKIWKIELMWQLLIKNEPAAETEVDILQT